MKLPHAIIIGAQKCATTGLLYTLNNHPDVWCAHADNYALVGMTPPSTGGGSELTFFSDNWDKGLEWYSNWFSPATEGKFLIEKSPDYCIYPKVAERIKATLPDCKFIYMIREPVSRAFSAYNHIQQDRAFHAPSALGVSFVEAVKNYPYLLHAGYYHKHLARWSSFFPKEQTLVIVQERLKKQPEVELARVLDFLKLPQVNLSNVESHVRVYEGRVIDPETKAELKQHFKLWNEKLFNYLGYNIPEWE